MTGQTLTPAAPTNGTSNPYVGPRPFQEDDVKKGRKLYGRQRETRQLLDLLIAERLVMLYSPSGAGKTSLLTAALIPQLQQKRFEVLPVIRVNQEPSQGFTLPPRANPYIFSLLLYLEKPLPIAKQTPLTELTGLTLTDYLDRWQATQAGLPLADYLNQLKDGTVKPKNLVLIFDQFEEILTIDSTNQAAKEAFFDQVGAALQQRWVWAIFSLREDYIAGLDPYLRPIPTRLSGKFRLELLRQDPAREAIQNPARDFGKNFTAEAANILVENLVQVRIQQRDGNMVEKPGLYVEPVQLQVVCSRLWANLPPEATEIKTEHLAVIGSVETALADYYAESVAAIADRYQVSERRIRDWFDEQLITPQGIRGQVLRTFDASQGLEDKVIDALVNTHLVRAEERRSAIWLELAHDSLIKPIRDDNVRWREANLSMVQRQAALWDQQKRAEGLLLTGDALVEAERWANAQVELLTPIEMDFLLRSQKAREEGELRLKAAAESARAEENARTAASLRRRAFWMAVFAFVAVVLAMIAGIFGVQANRNANLASLNQKNAQNAKLTAEAASTAAIQEKATAQAASTSAIEQQATAEAERNNAATWVANVEALLTIQASSAIGEFVPPSPTLTMEEVTATLTDLFTPPMETTPTVTPTTTPTPTPNLAATATIEMIKLQLAQVKATQTAVARIQIISIGQSVLGSPIEVNRLGNGPRHIVLIGGLHAGFAPGSVELAQMMVEYFKANLDQIPDKITLHIITNANPDSPSLPGKKEGRLNANGVDLNRNWDCNWKTVAEWAGQPISGGTSPFSEPESRALRDYLQQLTPTAVVFWGARYADGRVFAGRCGPSMVSNTLAQVYKEAASYTAGESLGYSVNGDATTWLDAQGIPAISVLLPEYTSADWSNNLKAVQAILQYYDD